MAGQSGDSTSVFSAPEVGWSVTIQYSVCSSLICSASTLSLSTVLHFTVVYLWQQKQATISSAGTIEIPVGNWIFMLKAEKRMIEILFSGFRDNLLITESFKYKRPSALHVWVVKVSLENSMASVH